LEESARFVRTASNKSQNFPPECRPTAEKQEGHLPVTGSQKPASRPLLPDQLGIWLDQEGSGAACAYNIGGAIWIDAVLDVPLFRRR
jgi:hypothetical protein